MKFVLQDLHSIFLICQVLHISSPKTTQVVISVTKWQAFLALQCKSNITKLILCTDDWRCDQYRWVNQGVKRLPKREPKVKKSYFNIQTPKGPSSDFSKHAYELDPTNNFTLIHYLGDESAANDFPHGNKKNDNRAHIRTCPSVLKELTTKCNKSTTSRVYKSAITSLPPVAHMPVLQPRNSKQVENIRMNQLQNL